MPDATTTLASIGTVIVSTSVSLATTVFTTYWPYFLVIGILTGLVFLFKRLLWAGHKS
jgi:hypothetical protein